MENVQAADSSAGKAVDSSAAAASSGRTTPAWNGLSGQAQEDVSRLARAALQNTALFAGNAAAGTAAQGNPGADAAAGGANLLDPLTAQLTPDQLAAVLAGGGYGAAALGSLGAAGLQPADNAAAFNALLLSGGLGLNAQNLLNPALGADLSALGALVGAEGGEMEEQVAPTKQGGLSVTSNKQLSSRFRGVCWNKKNKRWQAAINSSGKYLYLGSFTNEDDAARQFDRAAIKLRGKKAKLNFEYADYVDENGELLDEIILPQGATKDDGVRSSTGGARRGSKSTAADASGLDLAGLHPDIVNQAALAALMQQGAWQGMARSGKTAVVAQPLALEKEQVSVLLPPGCTMEYIVPVQEAGASGGGSSSGNGGGGSRTLFGVVYKDSGSGLFGAGVWTGYMFKAFGHYASEEAAAQTARSAAELLSEDRDLRVSGGVANQQSMGLMAAPAGLIAAPAGGAFSQDALALAGLAAAGLGGGGRGVAGSNPGAGMAGGLFAPGLMGAGMGSLANVSLAQAAQLAQQAAAEQGLPMSYPPLSVALPVVSAGLQLLPPGMPAVSGAAMGGGGDVAALGLDAASKATSEAEMQQLMQQLMAQQQQPDVQRQLLMQQQQLMAGADGGDGFLKLANLDMSQLRQQLMEQQQGLSADPSGTDVQQQEVLASIPGLDTAAGQKRRLDETADMAAAAATADAAAAAATAAAAGVDNGMGTAAVLGVQSVGEAAAAGMPTGSESPSAKRIKTDPMDAAAAAAATAAAAGEAVSMPMGMAMPGAGFMAASANMARVDLQDALKMLQTVQQQAAPNQE